MSELEQVKTLIGIEISNTDEDSLLNLLIERAGKIINELSRTPSTYEHLKVDATVFAYNQRGAEGNKTISSGGFSQSWYYDTMARFIKAHIPAQYVIK